MCVSLSTEPFLLSNQKPDHRNCLLQSISTTVDRGPLSAELDREARFILIRCVPSSEIGRVNRNCCLFPTRPTDPPPPTPYSPSNKPPLRNTKVPPYNENHLHPRHTHTDTDTDTHTPHERMPAPQTHTHSLAMLPSHETREVNGGIAKASSPTGQE